MRFPRRAMLSLPLAACAAPPAPGPAQAEAAADLWLAARGWHTEVLLDWPGEAALPPPFPPPGPLALSFGARDFFTAPVPGPAESLRALTPGPAALLAAPARLPPEGEAVGFRVGLPGRLALARFFASELAGGGPRLLAPGFSPGAVFLDARRSYALSYTCNAWTLDALAAAGVPVSSEGVVLASGAMAEARRALARS